MAAPRKEDVSNLIVSAMEELLQSKALSDISLAEIARTAGISKGTLYYHFKNKDEILFALMDNYLDEQWANLEEWTADASKDTSLPRLAKYILERDTEKVDQRFHFIYDATSGNDSIRLKLLERYEKFQLNIAEKIKERTSEIDADYLAWLLLILSDGLLVHKMLKNPDVDTEKFIKATEKYIKEML